MGRSGGRNKKLSVTTKTRSKASKRTSREQIATEITQAVLKAIKEEKILPWQKPWALNGIPKNIVSGKKYRGINNFLLNIAASDKNYNSGTWMTFKQAKEKSYKEWLKTNGKKDTPENLKEYESDPDNYKGVRRGEKGVQIVFYTDFEIEKDKNGNPLTDKNGNPTTQEVKVMRRYRVFNADQTDLDVPPDIKLRSSIEVNQAAEEVIKNMPSLPAIIHSGDRAGYNPTKDAIVIPDRQRFNSDAEYYQTLFHELIHATGHKSRVGRMDGSWASFGSDPYAEEELVAEIGAAMIMAELGIKTEQTTKNQTAYLAGWAKKLGSDHGAILSAAAEAETALDYIFSRN